MLLLTLFSNTQAQPSSVQQGDTTRYVVDTTWPKKPERFKWAQMAGIAVDKFRLLRNESTENISMVVIGANIEERERQIKEAKARIAKLAGEIEAEGEGTEKDGKPVENKTHTPIDDVEKVEITKPFTQT